MIDTALSGLLWTQTHLPSVAYVDAIWAARYPHFASGNEPKAKGQWPINRARHADAAPPATSPDRNVTNIAAFKPVQKKLDDDQIAGTIAEIAVLVRQKAKAL